MIDYFFFYLKRFIVAELNDWRNCLEERLVNINKRLCIYGVISQVEKFNDPWLLQAFLNQSIASHLFFN